MVLKVAMIGDGSVSRDLRGYLAASGRFEVLGVQRRQTEAGAAGEQFGRLLDAADVFVEAAGVAAVAEYGPRVVQAGKDLLVTSVGAFIDPALRRSVLHSGPGRVHLSSGAIGGLDLIRAAAASGGIDSVHLETRKRPVALLQEWMTAAERERITGSLEPQLLFEGNPAEAISRFPGSLNVAVALGLAVGDMDRVSISLIADPEAELTQHLITAGGAAGEYVFRIANQPSPAQPRSSGLTARALYSGLLRLTEPGGNFV
ncbi:aspartate dehydrogenase domain-containing protein [Arthrobacter russicus]|jgi:aspartate dehydrogenase|uniref:L-aspartate dehydrogenase n=1 Tax=Arthrobacter russicus TaxID=172040 RepID=A0ABU1J712_9MICC|nr:aspartate dehydrogenase domain-containing protein [Arthrobacter russicus]MDN5669687.1 DUF108 domain-containing protein [Renibacterium salmoninarum]MDR6268153.1 aspartate dehydrogenase [Arthrobacter russicus]